MNRIVNDPIPRVYILRSRSGKPYEVLLVYGLQELIVFTSTNYDRARSVCQALQDAEHQNALHHE